MSALAPDETSNSRLSETPGVRMIELRTTADAGVPFPDCASTPIVPELPPTAVELRTSTYADPDTESPLAPKAEAPEGAKSAISISTSFAKNGPRPPQT